MLAITIPSSLKPLLAVSEPVELIDESGQMLGTFVPSAVRQYWTTEELDAADAEPGGRTLDKSGNRLGSDEATETTSGVHAASRRASGLLGPTFRSGCASRMRFSTEARSRAFSRRGLSRSHTNGSSQDSEKAHEWASIAIHNAPKTRRKRRAK